MPDIQDYSQELLATTSEMKTYAFQYKTARGEWAKAFNKIQTLMHKAGLASDKASFDNKIPKLMAIKEFREETIELSTKLNESLALYKGLDRVLEAFKAHTSGIQSVIKYNMSGEIAEATRQKYGG